MIIYGFRVIFLKWDKDHTWDVMVQPGLLSLEKQKALEPRDMDCHQS